MHLIKSKTKMISKLLICPSITLRHAPRVCFKNWWSWRLGCQYLEHPWYWQDYYKCIRESHSMSRQWRTWCFYVVHSVPNDKASKDKLTSRLVMPRLTVLKIFCWLSSKSVRLMVVILREYVWICFLFNNQHRVDVGVPFDDFRKE